jgi:hypothetical protein
MASMQDDQASEIYKTGLNSTELLFSLSELVIAWLLLRQAEIAEAALESASGTDVDFYTGKVASARWFARNVLPKATRRRELAETEDGALMALPEAAF